MNKNELNDDITYITLKNGLLLDIGWYPEIFNFIISDAIALSDGITQNIPHGLNQ